MKKVREAIYLICSFHTVDLRKLVHEHELMRRLFFRTIWICSSLTRRIMFEAVWRMSTFITMSWLLSSFPMLSLLESGWWLRRPTWFSFTLRYCLVGPIRGYQEQGRRNEPTVMAVRSLRLGWWGWEKRIFQSRGCSVSLHEKSGKRNDQRFLLQDASR